MNEKFAVSTDLDCNKMVGSFIGHYLNLSFVFYTKDDLC